MMTQKPNRKKPNRMKPYVLGHKLVKVPEDDYYRAENRWYRFWWNVDRQKCDFERFLKVPKKWWPDQYHSVVTPTAARKIALLNSPHYHALLMAYKSKNLPEK